MDDEREGAEMECLFDLLTQSLFDPGLDDLPEVDPLFSQVPLPEDFELEPVATMVTGSTDATDQTHVIADTGPSNQRFGPLVSESDISKLQKAAVPANTKKNTNWALNVWKEWANDRKQRSPDDYPKQRKVYSIVATTICF